MDDVCLNRWLCSCNVELCCIKLVLLRTCTHCGNGPRRQWHNLPMRWLSSAGGRSLISTHAWNWNHYTSILLFMFVNRMSRAHFQTVCSQGFSRLLSLSFAFFIIMDVMGSCAVTLSWRLSTLIFESVQHHTQLRFENDALLFCFSKEKCHFPQTGYEIWVYSKAAFCFLVNSWSVKGAS